MKLNIQYECQKLVLALKSTQRWSRINKLGLIFSLTKILVSFCFLMRISWENDFLMRIFEIWWEFFMRFFAHENFIFLMRSFFFSWELKKLTRLFLDLVRFCIRLVGSLKRAHEGFHKLFYRHHTFPSSLFFQPDTNYNSLLLAPSVFLPSFPISNTANGLDHNCWQLLTKH